MSQVRSLELNLATRPFRNNTPLWIGFSLAAAGAIAFTFWNATTYLDQRARIAELTGQVSTAGSEMQDLTSRENRARMQIRDLDVENLNVQSKRANQFLMRRGLSWTRLFNLLEEVQPPEIKMTGIRPIFSREARGAPREGGIPDGVVPISVEGVAKSLDSFLELERQLLQDPHFGQVEPQRLDRVRNSEEFVFDLRFLYDPEGQLTPTGVKLPPVLDAQKEAEEGAVPDAPEPDAAPAPAEEEKQ